MADFITTLFVGILAAVAWFVVGGIVYMNPATAKIYKSYARHPSMKVWKTRQGYLLSVFFLGGVLLCVPGAFIYYLLKPSLSGEFLIDSLFFTSILVVVGIIPRGVNMWIQSSYPNKLLLIELFNGTILSFVVSSFYFFMI